MEISGRGVLGKFQSAIGKYNLDTTEAGLGMEHMGQLVRLGGCLHPPICYGQHIWGMGVGAAATVFPSPTRPLLVGMLILIFCELPKNKGQ